MTAAPICPGCNEPAELTDGTVIYPHRRDLSKHRFWRCAGCGGYVGCHPGSDRALGTPADGPLRSHRSLVHAAFDPLWRVNGGRKFFRSRTRAYAWLAEAMGLPADQCHVGMFDHERCALALQCIYRDFGSTA